MKKLVLLLLACAVWLWAADFWTSKPYTDWTSKDIQKLMTDSPWARRVDVEMGVRMPAGTSQSEGRGRGGRGSPSADIATPDGGQTSGADLTGTRGAGGAAGGAGADGPRTQTMPVLLLWQTALPVKQAVVKAKYGAEAATSAEAKALLEREEQYLILNVEGLPASAAQAGAGESKAALLKLTSLGVKGKEPLHAVEVQFNKRERVVDALFFFPRATSGAAGPFSADDKDLDFATKFDKLAIKYRFKLKDMMYQGKLEM